METARMKYGPTYAALLRKRTLLNDDLKKAQAGRDVHRLSPKAQARASAPRWARRWAVRPAGTPSESQAYAQRWHSIKAAAPELDDGQIHERARSELATAAAQAAAKNLWPKLDLKRLPQNGAQVMGMRGLRRAIKAKCKDCIYEPAAGGTWREQVAACTVAQCALWAVRPLPRYRGIPNGDMSNGTSVTVVPTAKVTMFGGARP